MAWRLLTGRVRLFGASCAAEEILASSTSTGGGRAELPYPGSAKRLCSNGNAVYKTSLRR